MLHNVLASDGEQRFRGLGVGELAPGFAERLEHEQALVLDLPAEAPLPADDPIVAGLRSGAVAGLLVEGELIGALSLGSSLPRAFSHDHLRVLRTVATHLALGLGNARLYDNIRRLHLSNLKALSLGAVGQGLLHARSRGPRRGLHGAARQGARLAPRDARAGRRGRLPARHRQDRHLRPRPAQAEPPEQPRVGAHAPAPELQRRHHRRALRPGARRRACAIITNAATATATPTAWPATTSRRWPR